jgi:hypothetical protein
VWGMVCTSHRTRLEGPTENVGAAAASPTLSICSNVTKYEPSVELVHTCLYVDADVRVRRKDCFR